MEKTKLKGAVLTFLILELVQLFGFLCRVPFSMRRAFEFDFVLYPLSSVTNFLAVVVLFCYCIVCLVTVFQLVVHNPKFLRSFQISGFIACFGNLVIYILRQMERSSAFFAFLDDYYWVLFLAALFWLSIWSMFFIRSSNVFSYMGENDLYLQMAFFTKNARRPEPWQPQPLPMPPPFVPMQQPIQPLAPPRPGSPYMPPQAPAGQAPYYGQPTYQGPYPQGPAAPPPPPNGKM